MIRFLHIALFGLLTALSLGASVPIGVKADGATAPDVEAGRVAFDTWLGRPTPYYVGFTSTDDWGSGFISMGFWKGRWADLTVPVIISIGLGPINEGDTTNHLTSIIAGTRDSYYEDAATDLLTWRTGDEFICIRLGWECTGTWYPWAPGDPDTSVTAADYIAAFQRVVTVMKAINSRLRFVFNVNLRSGSNAAAEALYPGDSYADVVSGDVYADINNPAPTSGSTAHYEIAAASNWTGVMTQAVGLEWFIGFQTDKPHAIDEWAAPRDYGPWVDGLATFLAGDGADFLWHCYWDSDSDFAGKISDDGHGTTSVRYLANFRVQSHSAPPTLMLFP